ncbi:retropepsin-like aspartic protease family protein [Runella sp.]|uniref:retropepsin-like aspartic protease family protein n=1 Tax=Runella sp. TaxID=1960881 RepID=UPI003D0D776A
MKKLLILSIIFLIFSCSSGNHTVIKVIDGNSFQLSNGVTVILTNVYKSDENIKILERYLRSNILLYDESNEEIKNFSSDQITAWVYNSNGDCVNNLLTGISEITKNKTPKIKKAKLEDNRTVVKFEQESGVLHIPVTINGVEMYFIFDTGAGLISISESVAFDLYKEEKLQDADFIGKGQFSDANGDITEGTIINLQSVIIGNRELVDVQACIIHGQNAPLLFGQSALQKFEKDSVDYSTKEIIFE